MARARNIKPTFFNNDVLAEIDPIGRLLFIGLWTLADYKGELEWREKRIKAQLLPYDNCDVKKLAINLDKSGFIRFYSDGDKIYLNINNFTKHQNPHKNEREKGSEIPSYCKDMRQLIDLKGLTINHDKSGLIPEDYGTNPADSFNQIPDSFNPITESLEKDPLSDKSDSISVLIYMNEILGTKYKPTTVSHIENINGRLSEGHTVEDCKLVIDAKKEQWSGDPKMAGYLRPQTLFSASKFQGYLMAAKSKPKQSSHNLNGKTYESGDL